MMGASGPSCAAIRRRYKNRVKFACAMFLTVLMLPACRTAHDVAMSSYRTATAPVDVVRPQVSAPGRSSTAAVSDVTKPGQSTAPARSSLPAQQKIAARNSDERKPKSAGEKPKPTPAPQVSAPLQFPTAKPVEGKPGYVYSPFDSSKYVDVSGYAPGSKVKDPYSGKIFLVP
jgi:hypothetical protein